MKSIIKFFALFSIILTISNCDNEVEWQQPNVELVPVFSITDITGNNAPAIAINIYREKPLIIEYSTEVNPISFDSSGYSDSSSETNYQISVTKIDNGQQIQYTVSGDKVTGVGTLTVDSNEVYDILISEEEIYN